MFGTFRFNDSLNEAEYVELSRDSGVDARGYTLLVSQDDPHDFLPRGGGLVHTSADQASQACNLCRALKVSPAWLNGYGPMTVVRIGPSRLTGRYSSSAAVTVAGVAGAWPRPQNAPTARMPMAMATGTVARPAEANRKGQPRGGGGKLLGWHHARPPTRTDARPRASMAT
jgi:hypothetical protein